MVVVSIVSIFVVAVYVNVTDVPCSGSMIFFFFVLRSSSIKLSMSVPSKPGRGSYLQIIKELQQNHMVVSKQCQLVISDSL